MRKLIGASVGVFFPFVRGFPLAGFLVTLVLKVCLPYLLGPAVIAVLLSQFMDGGASWGAVLFLGAGWVVLLQMARAAIKRRESLLAWHPGHCRAALLVLSLGISYRTGKATAGEESEQIPTYQFEG